MNLLSLTNTPVLLILIIVPILPNLWAIWHIFRCDFNTPQEKMAWLALAVFLPVLGGLAYLFWGKKRAQKTI
ncbi:MAG: PLD nuclease N-terminal domain-containing protein [Thermodesulfobacteriota bacterium]